MQKIDFYLAFRGGRSQWKGGSFIRRARWTRSWTIHRLGIVICHGITDYSSAAAVVPAPRVWGSYSAQVCQRQGCHSSRPCSGLPNHAFRDMSWLARPAARHRLLCKNNTQECDDGIAGTVLWAGGNVKSMFGNATHVTAGFSRASPRACIRRHRMAVSRPGTQCRRASRFKGSLFSKGRRLAPLGYGGLFPSPARRVHGIQALACWRGA